jgi:prepilin-type N-terminal cleavage/methylation domain-containing protein
MQRRAPAFTLIELLVVIVLIAVLAGVVVPSYGRWWGRTRFEGAVAQVRDLLAFSRERAVANDTMTVVTFDTRNQAFQAEVLPPPATQDQPVALTSDTNIDPNTGLIPQAPRSYKLAPEFTVVEFARMSDASGMNSNRPTTDLRFRGDGTCDGARITLASDAGYSAVLIVWPGTGRITVEDKQE